MISQTAEYALRAITQLAMNSEMPQTTQQIAEETLVPMPYLSKVLQALGRSKLIHARRGLNGGFRLLVPPEKLTVYDVVQAVDPLERIQSCPLGLKAHGTHLCPLHKKLDDAMDLVEQSFRSTTIAHILNEPTASKPLCTIRIESAFEAL